ncbi:SRPBCC family protein, partial [Enterococcus faecalis]
MKDTFRLENQTIYFGTEQAISASHQPIWRNLTET